jgi:CBS domain-containing protein
MMKRRMPVSTIMTKNLVTANVTDSLRHVTTLLKEHQIRHLPIVLGDKLVGIVSKTDIMRLSFGDMFDGQESTDQAIFDMLKLEQVMVSNPTTVQEDENIRDVAEKFTKAEFHAMPVLNGEKITGIITTTDLMKYLLEQYN